MESFMINNKTYTIQKELKFGEYRKINQVNSRLTNLSQSLGNTEDLSTLPAEQLNKLTREFTSANDDQLNIMVSFLESHLGLSQAEIDELSLNEAMQVFQEAFKRSTTPDKELKKTSVYQ